MHDYQLFPTSHLDSTERRIAALDGTEQAALFCSGSAAVATAIFGLLEPGDHIVVSEPLPRETRRFLADVAPRFGVLASFVAAGSDAVAAIREEASRIKADRLRLILIQTPADPTNTLIDIEGVAHLADRLSFKRERRVITAVDNSLLGPHHQKPAQFGADLVVYSDLGVISGPSSLIAPIAGMRTALGTGATPFAAWLLGSELDTLAVRRERQASTASHLAMVLSSHRTVEHVRHLSTIDLADPQHEIMRRQVTGPGAMLSFSVKGGGPQACRVIARLETLKADHPLPGLIRLHVGLEDPAELEGDLLRALQAVQPELREDVRTTQVIRVPII
jgi:methionine-gamma-lyase